MTATFDIILADHLEWKQTESGSWIELYSDHFDFVVDKDFVLYIYVLDTDYLYATRQCVDLSHAQFIAKAFEILAERNTRRGEDWMGRQWPPKEWRGVS